MTDLQRDVRVKLMEGGPKTEVELANELGVSKSEIQRAADAEETVVLVPDSAERTYRFQLRAKKTVSKFRDANIG